MALKFNVGDKVIAITGTGQRNGQEGTITAVDFHDATYPYLVKFGDNGTDWMRETLLKLVNAIHVEVIETKTVSLKDNINILDYVVYNKNNNIIVCRTSLKKIAEDAVATNREEFVMGIVKK